MFIIKSIGLLYKYIFECRASIMIKHDGSFLLKIRIEKLISSLKYDFIQVLNKRNNTGEFKLLGLQCTKNRHT
jgi:hypothetical protein